MSNPFFTINNTPGAISNDLPEDICVCYSAALSWIVIVTTVPPLSFYRFTVILYVTYLPQG